MVVENYHRKVMNGNVAYVGQSFQERVREKHQKKEENDGKTECVRLEELRISADQIICI